MSAVYREHGCQHHGEQLREGRERGQVTVAAGDLDYGGEQYEAAREDAQDSADERGQHLGRRQGNRHFRRGCAEGAR